MTVSDAVEKNLYLQKKGDKITIGKKTYVVESVVPVDYFLLQKAMNKSLELAVMALYPFFYIPLINRSSPAYTS